MYIVCILQAALVSVVVLNVAPDMDIFRDMAVACWKIMKKLLQILMHKPLTSHHHSTEPDSFVVKKFKWT